MDRDDVMVKLGSIEAKLDALLPLAERVTSLEKWQNRMAGGVAVITILFTVIVAAVKGWFSNVR